MHRPRFRSGADAALRGRLRPRLLPPLAAVAALAVPAAALAGTVHAQAGLRLAHAAAIAPPSAISVASTTRTSVTLTWQPSTAAVAGYELYRSGVAIGTTTATTATWSGLNCGSTYRFGVLAFGSGKPVPVSARVDFSASTAPCGGPPPSPPGPIQAPRDLRVVGVTQTSMTLAWSEASSDVAGYDLYRSGVVLATTVQTTATWSGLNCGSPYRFSVVAWAAGHTRASSRVDFTTSTAACTGPAPAVPPPAASPPPAAPPAPGPAGTLYVSSSGTDASPCTQAAPCASFNRAYQLARIGQVVQIAGGSYGDQLLSGAGKSGSGAVVFQPAPGAAVSIGELRVAGVDDAEFRDLKMNDWYVDAGSDSITFRNVSARYFFVRSASNVSVLGGSVGGEDDAISPTVGAAYQSTVPSRNVLFDGVAFHDITRANKPGDHLECLFIQSVDGLVLRNSSFTHCDVFDVYVNNILDGPVPRNVLIGQNTFGTATDGGYYSLYVRNDPGDVISGLTIRGNTFAQGFHLDAGNYVDTHVVDNTSPLTQSQCVTGIDWSGNSFAGAACGPTDTNTAK